MEIVRTTACPNTARKAKDAMLEAMKDELQRKAPSGDPAAALAQRGFPNPVIRELSPVAAQAVSRANTTRK